MLGRGPGWVRLADVAKGGAEGRKLANRIPAGRIKKNKWGEPQSQLLAGGEMGNIRERALAYYTMWKLEKEKKTGRERNTQLERKNGETKSQNA